MRDVHERFTLDGFMVLLWGRWPAVNYSAWNSRWGISRGRGFTRRHAIRRVRRGIVRCKAAYAQLYPEGRQP
jgi:hypothetical protein